MGRSSSRIWAHTGSLRTRSMSEDAVRGLITPRNSINEAALAAAPKAAAMGTGRKVYRGESVVRGILDVLSGCCELFDAGDAAERSTNRYSPRGICKPREPWSCRAA